VPEDKKKTDPRVELKIINEAWIDILLALIQQIEGVLMKLIMSDNFRGDKDKLRSILRDVKAAAASVSTGSNGNGN
jgi:hypothetical protein